MNLKLIFFPLTLIVSVAIFIWVAKPEWEDLKANKAELATLTEKRDGLVNSKQNIQKAYNEYEALDEADIELINNAIPNDANNDDFLAEIYKNTQQSGAFLVATQLKDDKSSSLELQKCLQQQKAAQASSDEVGEESQTATASIYCPTVKRTILAEAETVGSFQNIKEFVKMVDTQNRLVVPSKLVIERLTSSVEAEGVEISDNMLRSSLDFDFFDKEKDEKIALSSLVEGNDKVLNSLMMGSVNDQAIEAFKSAITSEAFRPVTVEEMGKVDIFAD